MRDVYEAVMETSAILPRHPAETSGPGEVLGAFVDDLMADAEQQLLQRLAGINIYEMDQAVRGPIKEILQNRERMKKRLD